MSNCRGYRNNLPKKQWNLWFQIFAVFHLDQMLLYIGEDSMEFMLIGVLMGVEFDESALEDFYEVAHDRVVGLLLLASGKPRINRHLFIYIIS